MSSLHQQYRIQNAADDAMVDECQSLDYRIAKSRKRMGEARWAECQRNWNDPNFDGGKLEANQ